MLLGRVRGQPFYTLVDHAEGQRNVRVCMAGNVEWGEFGWHYGGFGL